MIEGRKDKKIEAEAQGGRAVEGRCRKEKVLQLEELYVVGKTELVC